MLILVLLRDDDQNNGWKRADWERESEKFLKGFVAPISIGPDLCGHEHESVLARGLCMRAQISRVNLKSGFQRRDTVQVTVG